MASAAHLTDRAASFSFVGHPLSSSNIAAITREYPFVPFSDIFITILACTCGQDVATYSPMDFERTPWCPAHVDSSRCYYLVRRDVDHHTDAIIRV